MEPFIHGLRRLGWLGQDSTNIEEATKNYAAFHGLSSLDAISVHINEPRICGLPDVMPISQNVCKWPDPDITWDVVAEINGLSKEDVVRSITEALARWARVCGIRPTYSPGNRQAKILVGSRSIDGPMGVLAESELPCGATQCRQWYDAESWAIFDGAGSRNAIDFVRVAMHELGHALGMNHIGSGNLLAPVYSRTIWDAQAGDIAEMVARYGPPITVPVPQAPNSEDYVIRVTGKMTIDGCRVTRLIME